MLEFMTVKGKVQRATWYDANTRVDALTLAFEQLLFFKKSQSNTYPHRIRYSYLDVYFQTLSSFSSFAAVVDEILGGNTIVTGKLVILGNALALCILAFCIRSASINTKLAMASTIGTARGTTHGS